MVVEIGSSNFHKRNVIVMKMYHNKQKPFIVHYCKFKNFCNSLKKKMKYFFQNYNATKVPFKKLKESVGRTFDKHASLKKTC